MGYTTDFDGQFDLNKPLTEDHRRYLKQFAETRRVERNPAKASTLPDPLREAVGLPIGVDGEFFVGGKGDFGQDHDDSIMDGNNPPKTQPGLWMQWVPNEEGTAIRWDYGEKFYEYELWLQYMIDNFLGPWGYILNGSVEWQGEDRSDIGRIVVTNNVIKVELGSVYYS